MIVPFLQRFRKTETIGMDIGSTGVKILKLQGEGRAGGILHWFFPGSLLEHPEREVGSFREFLRANHLSGASVACNIEDPSLKIRRVDLPKMPDYDLKEAVRWELRTAVEGPVADYSVRFSPVEEYLVGETRRLALVAYAIHKTAVARRLELLRKASLKVVALEPTSVSLLAVFDRVVGWQPGRFHGLIDFGEAKAVFTAMSEGKLFFSRPLLGVSGRDLLGLLQKELGLSNGDAEELKRDLMRGNLATGRFSGLKERAESLLPGFYIHVSLEIQRSMDAFSLMFRKEKIHQLWLCGGGAKLPGIVDSLTKNLAVPTALLEASSKFRMPETLAHLLDVALGLALYGD